MAVKTTTKKKTTAVRKRVVRKRKTVKAKARRIVTPKKQAEGSYPVKIAIIACIFILSLFMAYVIVGNKNGPGKPAKHMTSLGNSAPQCMDHAYTGGAEIKGWLVDEGGKNYIRIPADEMTKLPENETTRSLRQIEEDKKIIAVDMNQEIKDTFKESSTENQKLIRITGFATTCEGEMLASLEYKDGIFREFLN